MQRQYRKKPVPFLMDTTENIGSPAEVFPERISIDQLRKIWNDKNVQYTDEELLRIRDWLYTMAGVIVQVVENNDGDEAIIVTAKKKRPKRKQPPIVFVEAAKKAA